MLNDQSLSIKVRKKIEKIIKKKRKIEDKIKQAKEMGDSAKVEKLENKTKKLEEGMKKMLELKDGKLEKVEGEEEKKPVEQKAVDEKEVASPQPNPFEDIVELKDIPGNEQQAQQQIPVQPIQQPIQVQPIQQPIMPGQQHIPPQEMVQQPQVSQPPVKVPQPLADVEVNISLVGGITVKIPTTGEHLERFLQEIADSIDSQASMQIGNQLINGRNIVIVQF